VPAERHYGLVTHRPSPAAAAFAGWLHRHCAALGATENSSAAA
jgi:LysR family transcriptional regulator, glycine cleavage system transcriptional activator